MKLQNRILVILALLTTIILLFFASYQFIRFRESKLLYNESLKSQDLVIDKVLQINRLRFEQLINDNSGWDEMVNFVHHPDSSWADENVDFFVNSFGLSFVMVFNAESNPVYQFGNNEMMKNVDFLKPQLFTEQFLNNPFPHFFVVLNNELVEFFGATIVPAADADDRKTVPNGFIFIAKQWDNKTQEDLEQATNFNTEIVFGTSDKLAQTESGLISFHRELADYSSKVVAEIIFKRVDPVAKEKSLLLLLSVLVLTFAVVSVFILMYYIRSTVIQPLRQISETLGHKNPNLLNDETDKVFEFKQIKEMITGYFQQETELKSSYAELKQINAAKSKLFSIVAVNLKNPVEGLITLSELLEDSLKRQDNETTKELLDMIGNQANQTLQLLETLLNWSKLQADNMIFNPEETNLKLVIDQVLNDLKLSSQLKNIGVETDIPKQIMVNSDYKMLKAILKNLVSNAIKFTYSGGWVKISAKTDGNFARIVVSDNGVGISQENFRKLFSIDNTLPGIGTDNERGAGLGLIISKTFVEKHGGVISVVSDEGIGSAFSFTIPLAKTDEQ
ncbi:MAG: ATP-binding protein [Draconibacterium sp.]